MDFVPKLDQSNGDLVGHEPLHVVQKTPKGPLCMKEGFVYWLEEPKSILHIWIKYEGPLKTWDRNGSKKAFY